MTLESLANALLSGELTYEAASLRASALMGRHPRWLDNVVRKFIATFDGRTRPRLTEAVRYLRTRHQLRSLAALRPTFDLSAEQVMQPVPAARAFALPAIVSPGDLAEWLCLGTSELEWLADLRHLARPGHYHYSTMEKKSGALRVLEAPKLRLKAVQGRILHEILDLVPGHEAVHGFRRRRSILSFAAPHTAKPLVLRMDLEDFFPSIGRARVQALFRTLGYPESVADLLGGLCTNIAPIGGPLYRQPHLPQGAPTSPALANLCFYRADCRIAGLARKAGLAYTRYADDLAFSGDRVSDTVRNRIAAIVSEEGFRVQHRKTRLMRRGVRQHLAGIVVNVTCNVERDEFDRLKAILHNCVRSGPESQNRDNHPRFKDHLTGRVAFVESVNPLRGRKLRAQLDKVQWD